MCECARVVFKDQGPKPKDRLRIANGVVNAAQGTCSWIPTKFFKKINKRNAKAEAGAEDAARTFGQDGTSSPTVPIKKKLRNVSEYN